MAIASSSPMQLIEAVVERFSLQDSFDILHSAQGETHGKPHPAVFLSAASRLGVAPQDCTVLEDSFHGVVAGLAARMKVIAIPDALSQQDPRFNASSILLNSLEELREKHL
jgi:sugar-phosphatase